MKDPFIEGVELALADSGLNPRAFRVERLQAITGTSEKILVALVVTVPWESLLENRSDEARRDLARGLVFTALGGLSKPLQERDTP